MIFDVLDLREPDTILASLWTQQAADEALRRLLSLGVEADPALDDFIVVVPRTEEVQP